MRVLALLMSLGLTGCFHLTGQVVEQRQAESVRVKSYQRQVSLPKQTSVELKTEIADGQLRIAAVAEKWCRTELVEVFENKDRVTEKLPGYHWAVLAGSLIVAAGGAASWAIGADLLPPKYSLKIEEASVEEERDLGHILVPLGISLTALGGLVLGSHTVDAVMLDEHTRELDKTHRVINHGSGPCSREAASNLAVGLDPMVRGVGNRVTVTTNKRGNARISILDSNLWKLPYAEPFLTLTCKKCRPASVTLPKRLAARLVLKRERREEMVAWLSRHGDTEMADEVRGALEKLKVVAEKKELPDPYDMLAYVKTSIRKSRFDSAREALEECVESHPSFKPCRLLELEFTKQRVKSLSKQARSFLRWRKPIKAVIWADKCLQYDATSRICQSIKESASSRWSQTNMKGKYRIRELTTEAGVAQVQGDFRAPGRYATMYLAIRLYRGGKELCRDKATVNQVTSRRSISFTGQCDVSGRQPDGVKVTIDGYRL